MHPNRSDKSLDDILKQPIPHTEFELQKENDFLHMRLQQLSKEITQIKEHENLQEAYQDKLELYEAAIEEVTAENTHLVLQLNQVESLEKEKKELQASVSDFNRQIRKLKSDIADLNH